MASDDGGPAFPCMAEHFGVGIESHRQDDRPGHPCSQGLTLRDWLAGQALVALESHLPATRPITLMGATVIAMSAYNIADAMLAARKRREPEPDP